MFRHDVQFYERDAFLIEVVVDFIAPAVTAGEAALVIATREHLDLLQATPFVSSWHELSGEQDRLVLLEAGNTLETFMVDGLPDEGRFFDVVGGLVHQLTAQGRRQVSAFGEMVAVLYEQGNGEAAVRLEQLWDSLSHRHQFSLLCAYPMRAFPDSGHRHAFECICAAHLRINPVERDATARPEALHRTIALLQQQANALEVEVSRRRDYERALESQSACISSMRSAQAELETLAGQDRLTGLTNRRVFDDRLANAVDRATRSGQTLVLIYIDLDEFKALNDRLGHSAGDDLLKQVGMRLQTCVRTVDTVCRWGGDEFAIIMEDADSAQGALLMERIAAAMCEPFEVEHTQIMVAASAGMSLCPDDSTEAADLIRSADAAMYQSKRVARSRRQPLSHGGMQMIVPAHPGYLTVETAADQLKLSRPHVLKLIAENRFQQIMHQDCGTPLICEQEVDRLASELQAK